LLDLSDPFMIMALLAAAASAYGFGFMAGEKREHRRWIENMKRLARMKREGLL
jgi:hypothetical protein